MIDIHILTYSGTKAEWLEQCLASLKPEGFTVHVIQGDEGHVGRGRARGYQCGQEEWVGYVDSDDYVLPGVGNALREALRENARMNVGITGVCTLEQAEWQGRPLFRKPKANHHLVVYRRDAIAQQFPVMRQSAFLCDRLAMSALNPATVPFIGYVWRQHPDQGHRRINWGTPTPNTRGK